MTGRPVLFGLLGVVATAAAVLSFAALRDLAQVCGFAPWLAWLLPVVVDAGAAAGSLVWLGGAAAEPARRFARALALALLGLSVAANALGHGLAAFFLAPAWWVVVIVSAIAPAVLGAVVHLAVLVGRIDLAPEPEAAASADGPTRDDHETAEPEGDRVTELIAAGAGRRRLSRELEITEYEARVLLDRAREPVTPGENAADEAADTGTTYAITLRRPAMTATLVILVALVVAAPIMWNRGSRGIAVALGAVALLPAITLVQQIPVPVLIGLAVVAAVVMVHRLSRTSATVTRWGARIRRKAGVASTLDITRVASATAMRRKAGTVRPSLKPASRSGRARQLLGVGLPVAEVAVKLCRVGFLRVWASVEDVVLAFGGPRVGKTQWLAGRVIDAPGALLVTSTRTDLYDQTAALRARRGPVFVFNAVGLAGLDSTITFDPLTGCADPVTASERATDMLGAVSRGGGDREFWEGQGRRVLAALLHAAALDDGASTMADVLRWVSSPDQAEREVTGLLRKSSVTAFQDDAAQFVTTNDKTRSSITSTIMPALGWLTSPAAAAAGTPSATPFDVADLLVRRATVYLLGGEETQAAPLVCALTGHIAREARRLAATRPGGRLDPPLTLSLDEAALISPVPLDKWTADMGGRGVTIIANFQSRAQMLDRYGDAKTATIINNSGAKVVFGGTSDRDDLNYWSSLSGDRDEPITTTDLHGRVASRTVRRVPVLAPAQLANLPAGKVVVFRRGMPPVVGRAEQAWRRRDIRELNTPESAWRRARGRALAVVTNGAAAVVRWRPRRAAIDATPPVTGDRNPGASPWGAEPWNARPWPLPPGDEGGSDGPEHGRWN